MRIKLQNTQHPHRERAHVCQIVNIFGKLNEVLTLPSRREIPITSAQVEPQRALRLGEQYRTRSDNFAFKRSQFSLDCHFMNAQY